jgi:hypothetical protein
MTSSNSMALSAWFITLSAALTFVDAGVFWSNITFNKVVAAAEDPCCSRLIVCERASRRALRILPPFLACNDLPSKIAALDRREDELSSETQSVRSARQFTFCYDRRSTTRPLPVKLTLRDFQGSI